MVDLIFVLRVQLITAGLHACMQVSCQCRRCERQPCKADLQLFITSKSRLYEIKQREEEYIATRVDLMMAARTESHDRASGGSTNTACPPNEPLITTEEIEEKPWKYIGYRGYSEFISSENDFYILRGFKSLNTRIALAQQDQIAVLEERLKALNIEYGRRDAEDRHNGSFRSDRDDRTELVDLISEKLSLYSKTSRCNNLCTSAE
jgi:hypothetical protein